MLSEEQILSLARKCVKTAAYVMNLSAFNVPVELVNDPAIIDDTLFLTDTNTIQLNLAQLRPFTNEYIPYIFIQGTVRYFQPGTFHLDEVCCFYLYLFLYCVHNNHFSYSYTSVS